MAHYDELKFNLLFNFFAFKNCCGDLYLQNYNKFFPDTNREDEDYLKNINSINSILNEKKNLVVIMSHKWWNYLHYTKDYKTINNLSLLELKKNNLFDDLILAINDIIKNQHSIILIYPTVNMNVDVPRHVLKKYLTIYDKLNSKNKNIFRIRSICKKIFLYNNHVYK